MATVEVNGAQLYYEERGDGPPLLLLHGTGAYADLWLPVLDGLARTFRVIAYDRRGFGRSTAEPARRFSDHAGDAAGLLDALDASPANVVGWSAGGVVALDLATMHPKHVTNLVLAEPAVHLLTHARRSVISMQTRSAFNRFLRRDSGAAATIMYRWASAATKGGNTFDSLPEAWRDQMVRNGASTVREMDQLMWPHPSRSAIRSITCPVTVIEGTLSDSVFPAADAFVTHLLPNARLVTLPGAAHFLHIDQPDRWVEAVASACQFG